MIVDFRWGETSQMSEMLIGEEEVESWVKRIDAMSISELATLHRRTKVGHPVFTNPVLYKQFTDRVDSLGGITPEVLLIIKKY